MLTCAHTVVTCLNPYDFIRKYRCESCHGVMMCACEEEFGRRFLPHQLDQGTVLDTRERVPVTLGFQPKICRPCRGLLEEAHPKAELYGRKSKILRYYWREIWFEQTRRFEEWKEQQRAWGTNDSVKEREMRETIERQVIDEFKELHSRSPKYQFNDESQSQVLRECKVELVNLDGTFVKTDERKVVLLDGMATCSAEEFTSRHFERLGCSVLVTESRPLHVLFGTFLWLLIQAPDDPQVRIVSFGERAAFDRGERGEQIWTHLPEDFGAPGYATRRADAIENHFKSMLAGDTESLLWAFDYWIPHSDNFRNYLWAEWHFQLLVCRAVHTANAARLGLLFSERLV